MHSMCLRIPVIWLVLLCAVALCYGTSWGATPELELSCLFRRKCVCVDASSMNAPVDDRTLLPSTLITADTDREDGLACGIVYFAYSIRYLDNGALGKSPFSRTTADLIGGDLSEVLLLYLGSFSSFHLQCNVDDWKQQGKPTVLNGTCVTVCAGGENVCEREVESMVALLRNTTIKRSEKPTLRLISFKLIAAPASFRFNLSKLVPVKNIVNQDELRITTTMSTSTVRKTDSRLTATTESESESENENESIRPDDNDDKGVDPDGTQTDDRQTVGTQTDGTQTDAIQSNGEQVVVGTGTVVSTDDIWGVLVHPGVLVALSAGGLLVVSLSVLLVLFTIKRMRKRDRGSYVLDDAHRKAPLLGPSAQTASAQMYNGYPSPPAREFYA